MVRMKLISVDGVGEKDVVGRIHSVSQRNRSRVGSFGGRVGTWLNAKDEFRHMKAIRSCFGSGAPSKFRKNRSVMVAVGSSTPQARSKSRTRTP